LQGVYIDRFTGIAPNPGRHHHQGIEQPWAGHTSEKSIEGENVI
jgi:hypothetical protein